MVSLDPGARFRIVSERMPVTEGLSRSVATSLRWSVAAKGFGQVLSWVMTLIVVRLLAPSDYGLAAMANVVIGLLAMVAELGFGASLIQAQSIERRQASGVLGAATVVNIAIAATLVLAAPAIAIFFHDPRLTTIIAVSAIQLPLAVVGLIPDAVLRRDLRFREIALAGVGSGLVGSGVTLVLAFQGAGVWALVIGAVVIVGVRGLLVQMFAPYRVLPTFRVEGIAEFVAFGSQVTGIRILWYAFSQADVLIAGRLLGPQILGIYTVAVHLATLPMQRIGSIVNDVAFPAFARIQSDQEAVATNVKRGIRLMSTLAFPMLWGVACVAPEMVRLILGSKWESTIIPLQLVASMVPLRMVNSVIASAFLGIGAARASLALATLTTAFAAVAYFVGAQHGLIGLGLSWLVITPITTYLTWVRMLPEFRLKITQALREMWLPALAATLMVGAVLGVRVLAAGASDFLRLILMIVSGVGACGLANVLVNRQPLVEIVDLLVPAWRVWIATALQRRARRR